MLIHTDNTVVNIKDFNDRCHRGCIKHWSNRGGCCFRVNRGKWLPNPFDSKYYLIKLLLSCNREDICTLIRLIRETR